MVDVTRATAIAAKQEAAVWREGECAGTVLKAGEFIQLLAERAPEDDLVAATGEVFAVRSVSETGGIFFVTGQAGDQAAVQRPDSHETVSRQGYDEVSIGRCDDVRHRTAQSQQSAFKGAVNVPDLKPRWIDVVIGSDQRASI